MHVTIWILAGFDWTVLGRENEGFEMVGGLRRVW